MKKALLIVNLGTPRSPSPSDVATYLREFLTDGYVIDIPNPFRWLLVNGIIAPFRSRKSAHAYQQVWTDEGSPLMVNSLRYVEKLKREESQRGEDGFEVKLAMRYGAPSLAHELRALIEAGRTEIYVWPMYPQYAQSSSETVLAVCREVFRSTQFKGNAYFLEDFCGDDAVAKIWADRILAEQKEFQADHLLLSYHGLPIRHVKRISEQCEGKGSCSFESTPFNKRCYRRQSFITSAAIQKQLGGAGEMGQRLVGKNTSIGFQSRLTSGWIEPFSDGFYRELPKSGVRRLLVACPSFVTDCLETLEEVALRGKEEFCAHGGEDLKLVPCLNDHEDWVKQSSLMAHDSARWQRFQI